MSYMMDANKHRFTNFVHDDGDNDKLNSWRDSYFMDMFCKYLKK